MKLSGQIQKKNILVVGDIMLDTYFNGKVKRISPEAPVPVFLKKGERSTLGGAANVAANLVAAGQNASMLAIIGQDAHGQQLLDGFAVQGVDSNLVLQVSDRSTTTKTRFLADNHQQLLRLDVEDSSAISKEEETVLLEKLQAQIDQFDLVILSDYMKGLLTYGFTQGVIRIAGQAGKKVIIDVKDPDYRKYEGAYLLKPNLKELRDLTKLPAQSDEEIIEASHTLCVQAKVEYVLTTCGGQGMVLVNRQRNARKIACAPQEVYDVTGAGDTVIAYLGTCMANGIKLERAMDIANIAAGIQVSKVGTSSVYVSEIERYMAHMQEDGVALPKILSWEQIPQLRKQTEQKQIVFTNGCFDILHIGHVRYLQEAAALGDVMIVGLNSDASVKRLKGEERPINCQEDRAELLAALGFIDYVIMFDEDTPYELIKQIQPDVLVKGGDYQPDQVVGKDIVEAKGGRLALIPFVAGKSTTNVINKIKHTES